MKYEIVYLKQAIRDLNQLDNTQRINVLKAINKVSQNPLPTNEGGYGKPLGNFNHNKLAGFLKIKLKKDGIRVVYQLIRTENIMRIVIIGFRNDNEVYEAAYKRINKSGR